MDIYSLSIIIALQTKTLLFLFLLAKILLYKFSYILHNICNDLHSPNASVWYVFVLLECNDMDPPVMLSEMMNFVMSEKRQHSFLFSLPFIYDLCEINRFREIVLVSIHLSSTNTIAAQIDLTILS